MEIECGLIIGKLVIEETSISRLVLSLTSTGISLKRALVRNGPFIRHSGIVGSLLMDGTVFRREPVIKNIVVDGDVTCIKGEVDGTVDRFNLVKCIINGYVDLSGITIDGKLIIRSTNIKGGYY